MNENNLNLKDFKIIYVFVSGGIDSTYLYEKLKKFYKDKVIPINCHNPFETNKTLELIKANDISFISLKSQKLKFPYKHYIIEAFKRLPFAINRLKIKGKYDKKTAFKCCYYIKHKALQQAKSLVSDNVCFISGIKAGDGKQRRIFLTQLKKGTYKSLKNKKPTFFLKHKTTNMIYVYPFRDYFYREFPNIVLKRLRIKYPNLNHSGCYFCPVLMMFNIQSEGMRYEASLKLVNKLKINSYQVENTKKR